MSYIRKNITAIIIFVVLTVAMTYPLVFKITSHIPGFFSSDELYGSVWNSWRIKYSINQHISLSHTPLIAYPSGVDLYKPWVFSYLWLVIFHALSIFTTPALTYNIIVLLNLFLNGFFTYILVSYVTKNRLAGIFGGICFAFCPYQFARVWQHLGLTNNEWIPFAILAAILFKNSLSKKYGILFLFGIVMPFYIDPTITYFVFVALAVFLAYTRDLKYFKRVFLIGIIALAMFMPQLLPIFANKPKDASSSQASGFNVYHRPFKDLFTQSAKPLSYFLPAAVHPVFGKFTEQFIGSPLYGVSYTEHALYLGWVALILAFIAFKKRRKRSDDEKFYIGFFALLAVAAWLFSQPPYFTFPYFKIYMPSFFSYKIFPMGRAYSRFGIVVMLAVAALAGFGLKFILERFKTNKAKIVFTSVMCALALFEFLNFPPFKVIDLTKYPKVYDWLKAQKGDFVIAEYPLDTDSPNEYYKFCQTVHEKKMINGTIPGTHVNDIERGIWKLSEPKTAEVLSRMDVRYVLAHLDIYSKSNEVEVSDELEKIKLQKMAGLKYIKRVEDVDVYEVTAKK